MKIFEEFEIINGFPALYWKKEEMVIISDLHLGIEGLMAESGIMLPKFQLKEIKKDIDEIIEIKKPKRILINGDVKHEFSGASFHEKIEIKELFSFLMDRIEEIFIVKGNHDNFIYYLIKDRKEIKLRDYFLFGDVLFMHGHLNFNLKNIGFRYLIIGNEHPAIGLRDEIGVKVKIPCFLYGDFDEKRKIIVLPSFSKLSSGMEMNDVLEGEVLSPVLKKVNIGRLKAIGIYEREILKFPEVGRINSGLRRIRS